MLTGTPRAPAGPAGPAEPASPWMRTVKFQSYQAEMNHTNFLEPNYFFVEANVL